MIQLVYSEYNKYFILVIIVILITMCCDAKGQVVYKQGNCIVGDTGQTFLNFYVNDTERNEFVSLRTQNVRYIVTSRVSNYTTVTFENDVITIRPSEQFVNYEATNSQDDLIVVEIKFYCTVGDLRIHVFLIHVVDTNNHDPIFVDEEENKEYIIYTPVGSGFPIIPLYGDLGAKDYDLTTNNISFSIEENPYFDISYNRRSENGTKMIYYATLRTKQIIYKLVEPIVLKITITDNDDTGNERRSNYKNIVIKGDTTFSIPIAPRFKKGLYKGSLEGQEQELRIEESIQLIWEGYNGDITIEVSDENFYAMYEDGRINIRWKQCDTLCYYTEQFVFEINAIMGNTNVASAAIQIINGRENNSAWTIQSLTIGISVLGIILVLLIVVVLFICYFRKSYKKISTPHEQGDNSHTINNSRDQMKHTTNNKENNGSKQSVPNNSDLLTSIENTESNLQVRLPPELELPIKNTDLEENNAIESLNIECQHDYRRIEND